MKKPVCFFTVASDKYLPFAKKMINSFNKFHKDIPMFLYGQKDIYNASKYGFKLGMLAPYFGSKLSEKYSLVVSIEADNIVCGKLDEILVNDYEVAGALNNYKGIPGFCLPNVSLDIYLNIGIIASNSKVFWDSWKFRTKKESHKYRFVEQDVVNLLLSDGDFKLKILDNEKSGLFYSSSIRKVWNNLKYDGKVVTCDGRIVKVIHWAGGESEKKLDYRARGFDSKVCNYFDYLTNE